MPRQMPTTLRLRFRAQTRGGSLLHHVPNRPPRFPTSAPPPGPSAHPSGFSIRSQRDSIGFNPTAFKTPVRTPVATEFNSGEHWYFTKFYATSARRSARSSGKRPNRQLVATRRHGSATVNSTHRLSLTLRSPPLFMKCPALRGVSRRSPKLSGPGVATALALQTISRVQP